MQNETYRLQPLSEKDNNNNNNNNNNIESFPDLSMVA
jgi:hypothetical protein